MSHSFTCLDGAVALIGACVRNSAEAVLRGCDDNHCTPDQKDLPFPISIVDKGGAESVDTSDLELKCSNADPNYGKLWFYCRSRPSDRAKNVMRCARDMLVSDLAKHAHIYISAMVRRAGVVAVLREELKCEMIATGIDHLRNQVYSYIEGSEKWDSVLKSRLQTTPSVINMLRENESNDGMVLLESTMSGSDFITGIVDVNKEKALGSLSLIERRMALFGSDLVLSWKPS